MVSICGQHWHLMCSGNSFFQFRRLYAENNFKKDLRNNAYQVIYYLTKVNTVQDLISEVIFTFNKIFQQAKPDFILIQ